MIIDSHYEELISESSKTGSIRVERKRYSGLKERSANQHSLSFSGKQSDLVFETSNISDVPSAFNPELDEIGKDLLIAQESHLKYLSGDGRPFEEFLAELC